MIIFLFVLCFVILMHFIHLYVCTWSSGYYISISDIPGGYLFAFIVYLILIDAQREFNKMGIFSQFRYLLFCLNSLWGKVHKPFFLEKQLSLKKNSLWKKKLLVVLIIGNATKFSLYYYLPSARGASNFIDLPNPICKSNFWTLP